MHNVVIHKFDTQAVKGEHIRSTSLMHNVVIHKFDKQAVKGEHIKSTSLIHNVAALTWVAAHSNLYRTDTSL